MNVAYLFCIKPRNANNNNNIYIYIYNNNTNKKCRFAKYYNAEIILHRIKFILYIRFILLTQIQMYI